MLVKVIPLKKIEEHYDYSLSQFLCDVVLCWCVLHTPYIIWLVILLNPQRIWATTSEVDSFRATIHTLGFSRVSVLSWVWHLFPALLSLWTDGFRLTDDGRLFPSLYFSTQECFTNIHVVFLFLKFTLGFVLFNIILNVDYWMTVGYFHPYT